MNTMVPGANPYEWVYNTIDSIDTVIGIGYFNPYSSTLTVNDVLEIYITKDKTIDFYEYYVTIIVNGVVTIETSQPEYIQRGLSTLSRLTTDIDDRLSSLEPSVDINATNIETNSISISDLSARVEALEADSGGPIISLPGLITWAVDAGSINEGSVNSFLLLRTDYGTIPSAGGVSTVTKAGGAGTYTYRTNVDADGAMAAYTSGNDITWGTTELSKLFELTSVSGVPDPSEDITLTSATSSPLGDGAATVLTVTALNTGGAEINGELNFDITAVVSINESSPTVDLTILRTNGSDGAVGCTITSSNITAEGGIDYRSVSELVSFADGVVTDTINIQLFEQPITSDKTFNCTLTLPTGGATLGSGTTKQVTISWNDGLRTTGDVDWNTIDPDTIPVFSAEALPITTTTTIDNKLIDGSALAADTHLINLTDDASVSITNCFIKNAPANGILIRRSGNTALEIRNNRIENCGGDVVSAADEETCGIRCFECNSVDGAGILDGAKVNNNYFWQNYGGGIYMFDCDGMTDSQMVANYCGGGTPSNTWGASANMFAIHFTSTISTFTMEHNVCNAPVAEYYNEADDHYIVRKSGAVAANTPVNVRYNRVRGGTDSTSGVCYQNGDATNNQYVMMDWNVGIEYTATGISLTANTDSSLSFNRMFATEQNPATSVGVGCQVWRSPDVAAGDFVDDTVQYNEVVHWRDPTPSITLNYWNPSTGVDDQTPNYGPGPASSNPTGWSTNISGDTGHRWNGNSSQDGYDELWYRRRVVVQPTNITGIFVENATNTCPAGDCTLAWNTTTNVLTFTAYGDSAGTGIDLDGTNPRTEAAYADGDMFDIASSIAEYGLEIIITDLATLKALGTTSDTDIAVVPPTSDGKYHYDMWMYAGTNGDFT